MTESTTTKLMNMFKTIKADPSSEANRFVETMKGERGVFWDGCVCCYRAIDLNELTLCCNRKGQCLCFTHECCLDVNLQPYPFKVDKAEDHVQVGLGICLLGLTKNFKTPCYGTERCLCFRGAQQCLPNDEMGDALTHPVCGCCCVECYPDVKFASQAPDGNFAVGMKKEVPVTAEIARDN